MSKQISNEIDMILNQNTSSILDKIAELQREIKVKVVKPSMCLTDVLKALHFDDNLTLADRLVMAIIYESDKVTTDLIIDLTTMSGAGTRRCLKKLTQLGYITRIKKGLYEKANTKIY